MKTHNGETSVKCHKCKCICDTDDDDVVGSLTGSGQKARLEQENTLRDNDFIRRLSNISLARSNILLAKDFLMLMSEVMLMLMIMLMLMLMLNFNVKF